MSFSPVFLSYAMMWGKIANFTESLAEESHKSLGLPYQDLKSRRQARAKEAADVRKDLETQIKQEQKKNEKMKRSIDENTKGLSNFIKMMKHKAPDQKYSKNQYASMFSKLSQKERQCFADGSYANGGGMTEKAAGGSKKTNRTPKKPKKEKEFDNFINDEASSSSESSGEDDNGNESDSSSGSSSSGGGSSSSGSSSDRGSGSESSDSEEGDPMGKITKRRYSKEGSPRKQLEREAQPIIKKFTWT
ncbi:zinc finger protein CCHC domain-containing protein, putative [Perkinsus marinus ATCC 50983]|uniref:Zinc finger protein CCHC domain-containing protein, putative n=1 Tax=Perkinsus marinus (strain ATCC 50983 / TXsc) TaxID=423536 RepID=C5K804_PERM5|nr:zinc finger protein CCHC domain-containing protein, putative [Perkinsus marinus ATCC 50983]EER19689.1 zinc finger protein CCHC domain-containing protein, putative [Perkinsus marinus ATCC 50983]|eukprot:XP_002787893.1 zinc finger protein CCHC domain-containing protein, putative [Perkinsus marinus ATCC 50983]